MHKRSARHTRNRKQGTMSVIGDPAIASVPICRVQLVREANCVLRATVETAEEAAEVIHEYLKFADREHFVILMLDVKQRLIGVHTVSIGTLYMAPVVPREVFKAAILANASSIICGHNHPSGDPMPSPEDCLLTERLCSVGELIDIPVQDHIIVGEYGRFVSLRMIGQVGRFGQHGFIQAT